MSRVVLAVWAATLVGCSAPPVVEGTSARVVGSGAPREEIVPLLPGGRVAARSVVVGSDAMCVLLVDGAVWCGGDLYRARLILGANQVPVSDVRSVVTAPGRWVALTARGEVFEWGRGPWGKGSLVPRSLGVTGAREIAASEQAVCVRFDDRVTCTGESDPPEWTVPVAARAISIRRGDRCYATDKAVHCAGAGATTEHPMPLVDELAASTLTTCARTRSQRVRCWRGEGSETADIDLFGSKPFARIAANQEGICATPAIGPSVCAPDAVRPSVARETTVEETLRGHRGASSVSLSQAGVCFVEAGVAYCAERPSGEGDVVPRAIDLGDVASLRAARQVGVGVEHVCVLGMDDAVRCWGGNRGGAVGGDEDARDAPERVPGLPPVARLAVGPHQTCVVTRASGDDPGGRVLCMGGWSDAHESVCQPPSWPCARAPTLVTTGAVDVTLGDAFGCVLDADGGVRCWGKNDYGQLGDDGGGDESATPTQVVDAAGKALTHVRKVVAGDLHACAIVDGDGAKGALWCWGYDDPGEQGRPLDAPGLLRVATPLPMPAPVVDVSGRCVLLDFSPESGGGEVRCWGDRAGGGYAIAPARVGVCDAVKLVGEDCALGPRGVTCVGGRPRRGDDFTELGEEAPAPAPMTLLDAVAYDRRVCGIDAQHRLLCRRILDPLPHVGAVVLPVFEPTSTAGGPGACPIDPPEYETRPFAVYRRNSVASDRSSRELTDEEALTLVASLRAAEPATCEQTAADLQISFFDARGVTPTYLVYVSACDAVYDRVDGRDRFLRPTAAGRTLLRALAKELGGPVPQRELR